MKYKQSKGRGIDTLMPFSILWASSACKCTKTFSTFFESFCVENRISEICANTDCGVISEKLEASEESPENTKFSQNLCVEGEDVIK